MMSSESMLILKHMFWLKQMELFKRMLQHFMLCFIYNESMNGVDASKHPLTLKKQPQAYDIFQKIV